MKKYAYQNFSLITIKEERWKDPGLELYFKVSSYGRIKRLKYELAYSDGRIYNKPEKIIKPVVMKISNRFMKDNLFFLRSRITLHKRIYDFSLGQVGISLFHKAI